MTQGATRELARFASRITLSDVPTEVISKIKALILDQLGAEIVAIDLPWTRSIKQYAKRHSREGASIVVVSGESLDAEYAALVNGTAGHGFEIDDYHPAPTHIGCVAVPATLAIALEQESTGEELLLASIIAFEIIARVANATMPSMIFDRGFHATCAHGVFGAAAAAGRLMGLSEADILMALSLAGSHASGTTEFSQTGGDVKRFHAGMGAAGGIRSARAAAFGMTGPPTVLEGKKGILQAFSADPHVNALVDGLGGQWALMETAIKPYTACGLLNPQIDALRDVMTRHKIRADDIERITVGGDRFAVVHVGSIGPAPKTIIGAQFSTHYSLAMSAVLGANDFSTYQAMAKENFENVRVSEMAHRIHIELDPECDKRFPDISKATITVVTKDGRTVHAEGYSYRDLSQDEIENKFHKLVDAALTLEQARGIVKAVERIEAIGNVTDLKRLLLRDKEEK
ncbi:MAG: MmgE/PrpD family protein [Betaproteobacteria bacterium]|nr:MmgE/PrpD family protein [Betaproteobacteria bacterium]